MQYDRLKQYEHLSESEMPQSLYMGEDRVTSSEQWEKLRKATFKGLIIMIEGFDFKRQVVPDVRRGVSKRSFINL